MPRLAASTPEVVLPPPLPPSATVLALRSNVKLAYISQFVSLFKSHVNLTFAIEDLEADLDGSRPGCCVPVLLGKLCNTLANDRNTNASNWMIALRRAYNRRLPQEDNPFYRYERVPIPLEQLDSDLPSALAANGHDKASGNPQLPSTTAATLRDREEDVKMDPAALADASTPLDRKPAASAEPIASTSAEPSTGSPIASTSALDKPSEQGVKVEDSAADTKENGAASAMNGQDGEQNEMALDYYEDRIEVEWSEVDLETKVDAIYNICHWHMNDAERFRRHLKFEDDLAWRLDPIGSDVKRNKYYFLDDHRLWIHRAPPPARRAPTSKPASAKSEGKGKAKAKPATAPAANKNKKKRALSPELAASPPREKLTENPSKRQRTSRAARGQDEWEAIPAELQAEWAREGESKDMKKEAVELGSEKRKREASEGASSALTSLGDEDEEEEDEDEEPVKPQRRPRPTYKKEEPERGSDFEPEEEAEEESESEAEEEEGSEAGTEGDEMMKWERDFWAERDRIEGLEGFVEWEAICVTRQEWESLLAKFATSKNKNERALRDLLKTELRPIVLESIEAREKAQLQELIALNRKRSTRIATMESEEDEKARLAAERAAESSKLSRASRHKIIANLNTSGGDDSTSEGGNSAAAGQESREERLKKREEEKAAREAAAEQAQLDEIRRMEREAAIKANGGIVPPGMETPEELEQIRLAKEKEERRIAREDAKVSKEQEKKNKAKEAKVARAEAKVVAQAAVVQPVYYADDEPPWYLDCEICKDAGWNLDDGQALIACDRCEEWQHLQCHVQANAIPGRPPIDFSADDFSFICVRCRMNPARPPRPVPTNLPRRVLAPPAPSPPVKRGRPKKEPPPKPKPAPPRPTPEQRKAMWGKPAAERAAHEGPSPPAPASNGAESRPAPPRATSSTPSTSKAASSGIPGPGQPPLSYDALKALIESQPVLINQLPPQYQQHFSQLFKIPCPYPTSTQNSPAPGASA